MLKKKAIVHLDTGATKEHEIEAEDDAGYVKWVNDCADALMGDPRGILVFTTPLCIYKVQNIVSIEFFEPPSQSDKLPIGYRLKSEPNPPSKT